jgi:hypothetical protein
VVGAEDPDAVGEGLLVQGDGPAQVPGVLVGADEVVAGGQGVGVVVAEDPLPVGEGALQVPGRAGDLALALQERSGLAEKRRWSGCPRRTRYGGSGRRCGGAVPARSAIRTLELVVIADLDTLLTALYVELTDRIIPSRGTPRRGPGRPRC